MIETECYIRTSESIALVNDAKDEKAENRAACSGGMVSVNCTQNANEMSKKSFV